MKVRLSPDGREVEFEGSVDEMHDLLDEHPLAQVQTADWSWLPAEKIYPTEDSIGIRVID